MSSRLETLLISALVTAGTLNYATKEGVADRDFSTYREEFEWLRRQSAIPSKSVFLTQFPDFRWRKVKIEDIPTIVAGLKEDSIKNRLAKVLETTAKKIKRTPGEELAVSLRDSVSDILEQSGTSGVTEIITEGSTFVKLFREKQKLNEQGQMYGIPTGLPTLDRVTGGLLPSQLYLIIARQGQAKTYLMLRMAAEACLLGKRILWVSREMPEDMVAYRMHSIMATILRGPDNTFSNLGLILGKDVDYDEYRKFIRYLRKEVTGRLFIPNDKRVGISQVEQYADRYAPDILFYDYIGIIASGQSGRSWQQLGEEANRAKEIAMKLNVPFALASQVNRAGAEDNEAPMVENISFGDSLGYAADRVFSLRLSNRDPETGKRILEIWIRKARYGEDDISIQAEFSGDRGHLKEIDSSAELLGGLMKDAKEDKTEKNSRSSNHRSRKAPRLRQGVTLKRR